MTNGPCRRPLPGQHDVGEADEAAREDAQRREARDERRATATSPARRARCAAPRTSSARPRTNVNTTTISTTMPTATPAAPKRRLEHGAEQRRGDHLAAEHEQQDAVQRLLRMLEQAQHAVARACRPPRRARSSRMRLTRTNAVSAQREHAGERQQHDDDDDRDGSSTGRHASGRVPVSGGAVTGPLTPFSSSSRNRARSSCSRRRITAASSASAWS